MHRSLTAVLLGVGLLSACTLIPKQPGADQVVLAKPDVVAQCRFLGSTNVSVMDRVGFIDRDPFKVEHDLAAVAKNSAVDMGGDTIVAASPIRDGKQTYKVYRCLR